MRARSLGLGLLLLAAVGVAAQDRARPPLVEWARDGRVLIAAGGLLARFDLDSGEEKLLDDAGATFALSPPDASDQQRLALGGPQRLELRSYPDFEPQATLALPNQTQVTALAWSPDGQTLAAGTRAGHLLLWEIESAELWADLGVDPASPLVRLDFSADSRRLLTAFEDGRAILWDILAREEVRRYSAPRDPSGRIEAETSVMALSPDGRRVLVNELRDEDSEFVLFDDAGRELWRRSGYALDFTPDGAGLLALAPPFRIAALYAVSDAAALRIFEPPEAMRTLYLVRVSPDAKFLLGVGEDYRGQVIVLWDFSTAEVLKTRR